MRLAAILAGAVLAAGVLAADPARYFSLADRVAWRLGTPAPGQTRLEDILHTLYRRGDALIGSDATLLLGDSHLHGFPTSLLPGSVNFSIGGETAAHLAERVADYTAPLRVRQVVLLTGRNDLAQGRAPEAVAESVGRILGYIPQRTVVVLLGIPTVRSGGNAVNSTREANRLLFGVCAARPGCRFVSTESLADAGGALDARVASADGVHLNPAGYAELAALIAAATQTPPQNQTLLPHRPTP
jgi:lysophospholipase L1-like esterase